MISALTQDSGIHTMSSRRDSAMSDSRSHDVHSYKKCHSDCLPLTQAMPRCISTQSLDKLTNQFQHLPNLNCNNQIEGVTVFPQPVESLHDLKTSLDACNKFNDPGGGAFGLSLQRSKNSYGNSNCVNYSAQNEQRGMSCS